MTLFFIDFENILSTGTRGVKNISPDDRVYLFYTSNSDKMDFRLFSELSAIGTRLELVEVVPGNNSLDFQLSTFLGSLVPAHKKDKFVIVSKDKGFSAVVDFWTKRQIAISQVNNMEMQDNDAIISDLSSRLPDYKKDIPEIVAMLIKYKTKVGLNNALVKKYGTDETKIIYKELKPYLKDKKGS